jgi:hypothetical protein
MTSCATCIHGCLTRSAAPCDRCEGFAMHEPRPEPWTLPPRTVVIDGKPLPLRWTERIIPTDEGESA